MKKAVLPFGNEWRIFLPMGKKVVAEYDAAERTLRLAEPLEDLNDHEEVEVEITRSARPKSSWMALEGTLSKEAADDLQNAINELFPPWE